MEKTGDIFDGLYARYPSLKQNSSEIAEAFELLAGTAANRGKILLCGNGGSCADCGHISGELLKGFLLRRELRADDIKKFEPFTGGKELARKLQYGICAIPLPSLTAALTAFVNDADPDAVYAQLVYAVGNRGDTVMCISTSGNSENICQAAVAARAAGLNVIGMTGENGGKLAPLCNTCIRVPEHDTFRVQELHLPVYHCLCAAVEEELFGRP